MAEDKLKYVKYLNLGFAVMGVIPLATPKKHIASWIGVKENEVTALNAGLMSFIPLTAIYVSLDYLLTKDTSPQIWKNKFLALAITQCIGMAITYKYKELYLQDKFKFLLGMHCATIAINFYAALAPIKEK
eukprot:192000_1